MGKYVSGVIKKRFNDEEMKEDLQLYKSALISFHYQALTYCNERACSISDQFEGMSVFVGAGYLFVFFTKSYNVSYLQENSVM